MHGIPDEVARTMLVRSAKPLQAGNAQAAAAETHASVNFEIDKLKLCNSEYCVYASLFLCIVKWCPQGKAPEQTSQELQKTGDDAAARAFGYHTGSSC